MAASSSSSKNWVFDVFPSFSGEDVRKRFLSHFLRELDRKLIIAFKDNEIERSHSLDPELKQAIRNSRIAVVIFSENYASSSWCLNELLEIVNCKEKFGQMVIPVFYGLEPSHVRKQTGDFGKIFEKTCQTKTEEEAQLWRQALTHVANLLGYHSHNWSNEAEMTGQIANDVLKKLLATTSTQDSNNFVGVEDHIAKMSELLELESEKVVVAGIWGSSGIGKTTIARTLFNQLSRHFQARIFIDSGFVAHSMQKYRRANLDDYNLKLDLQRNFLSEIFQKKDIQIDHLGVLGEKLKHQKLLIFIDDLHNEVVLDALGGQILHFGRGTRIVVITNDKDLLTAHGIDCIYEVGLPSTWGAMKMFCRYAFKQDDPPHGLRDFAYEVVELAGSLPLGLKIIGSSLRGKKKEDCLNLLPRFREFLNGKIEQTLMFSYEGLESEDQKIFRHIACFFNHREDPPDGLIELVDEVIKLAGSHPEGLKIVGSSLRGKKKEDCFELLHRFGEFLNGKIEQTLMFNYEGLDSEIQKKYSSMACFSNHMEAKYIKLLLAHSVLGVDVGLNNLVNKSLIHVREGRVGMQRLLQELL